MKRKNPKPLEDYTISELLNFKIPSNSRKELEKEGLEWTLINGILDTANYRLPTAKNKLSAALKDFQNIIESLNPKNY